MSKNTKYEKGLVSDTLAILPIIEAIRGEVRLHQELYNSLLDKIYDTGKLLLGFSLPALITVYTIKSEELQEGKFLMLTLGLVLFGVILMGTVFIIKLKLFGPYIFGNTARSNVLVSLLNVQNSWIKLNIKTKVRH